MIELLLEAERWLTAGRLDEAERLYRQAADGDPHNSIAVVGLARVALERGDEGAAFDLGRRALAIDAENAAARRLVERLEEVRRVRGDAPAEGDALAAGGQTPAAGGHAPAAGGHAPAAEGAGGQAPAAGPPAPRRGLLARLGIRR